MATHTGPEFIAASAEARRVVRELRTQLGLSRATLEKRAKVGTDYLKRLELGRHPTVEATRLRRVLQVLEHAAARGQVPSQLTTRLARVLKAVAQPSPGARGQAGRGRRTPA
jgi:transcriptional regulator with XRE-family HTH domain